jgi:hypothetical protein
MAYSDDDKFFEKYDVRRKDTGEKVEGPLFTLAFARDPHARVALAAYADSVESELPQLATDLRKALDDTK